MSLLVNTTSDPSPEMSPTWTSAISEKSKSFYTVQFNIIIGEKNGSLWHR
jgi:hypothetical protein